MKKILIALDIIILMMSCNPIENKSSIIWISGFKTTCENGAGTTECLLISKNASLSDENWELFYAEIDGFNFEEGILKKVEIVEQRPEDAADKSTIKYSLVKVLEMQPDDRVLLRKDWSLELIKGESLNDSIKRPMLKINLAEMTLNGNAGCNSYRGTFSEIGIEKISISNLANTLKVCPEESYEDQYLNLLNQIVSYKVEQSKLKLIDKAHNTLLVFVNDHTSNPVRINDIWSAVRVDGFPINRMVTIPRLEVNTQEMKVYGNDGCNAYFGSISNITNASITIENIGSTRKMCPEMEFPERYMSALKKTVQYKFENNALVFSDAGNQEVLAFIKGDGSL